MAIREQQRLVLTSKAILMVGSLRVLIQDLEPSNLTRFFPKWKKVTKFLEFLSTMASNLHWAFILRFLWKSPLLCQMHSTIRPTVSLEWVMSRLLLTLRCYWLMILVKGKKTLSLPT